MARTIQVQDLGRVQRIVRVLASNGFGHALERTGLGEHVPPGKVDSDSSPFARRLRQALVDLGPTFVKLGQILSVRPDILPKDVLAEFQTLQDRVDPLSPEEVRGVVERELGKTIEDAFSSFDPEPLGCASIAQVHRAVLLDGREVAVKLQRPGIEQVIRSDVHILYTLAQIVEGRASLPGMYTPTAIVKEFDDAITLELDFLQEARASARMRNNFADDPDILVPEVYPELSTRRLLIMELVRARPLSSIPEGKVTPRTRKIAHRLMEATYRQVFVHGFFHCDPHPGNLLVTDDDRLVYLDFGITGTLTSAMQDTLLSAFTSLVFRDPDALALAVHRAGATRGRVDVRAFRDELERLMIKYYGASLDQLADPATLMEVVELSSRYRIDLPAEFAVLSRTVGLVEGILRELLPGVDIVDEVKPYAQRLITSRFSPERMTADAARSIMQLQGHLQTAPLALSQVLMDLEGGRLTFRMIDPEADKLREEIRMATLRLSLAALASTVTLGSLLFLAAWSPAPFGIPIMGLLGLALAWVGASLFGVLGVHVLFARFLQPSVWRRRAMAVVRFFGRRKD